MHRYRPIRGRWAWTAAATALIACGTAVLGVAGPSTAALPTGVAAAPVPAWTARAAARFWTHQRMAQARPLVAGNPRTGGTGGAHLSPDSLADTPLPTDSATATATPTPTDTAIPSPTPTPSDSGSATATATPTGTASATPTGTASATPPPPPSPSPSSSATGVPSTHFGGVPDIGRMYLTRGSGSYFCTASVVASPQHDIILTAGHCLAGASAGEKLAFVPQWTAADPTPYGIFPVNQDSEGRSRVWIDPRYYDLGRVQGDQWDVAFAEVGAGPGGRRVQDVVGADHLATGRGYTFSPVTLIGYPGGDAQPLTCTSSTTEFTPTDGTPGSFLRVPCDGYRDGTSGGPFLVDVDPATGTGDLVGIIGGWDTGGPTADVSYSSYFGSDIQQLYDAAVAGGAPARPGVLPAAAVWQQATALASGFFAPSPTPGRDYSDLVARYTDGSLVLYRGAGGGRFDKAVTLAGAGSAFRNAVSLTAGDFTGADTYDLLVRWADGSLSLYPDVDAAGLHRQIRLVGPGSLWKHAVTITAGRFSTTDHWPDDLVVRWSDGEMTLYPDVDAQGLHREVQLLRPNPRWTHAVSISAGDFAGADTWDLMVRTDDGTLLLLPDVDEHGLHQEIRVRPPGSLWTHATVATAGAYAGDVWTDDYLVRWSDGEVSVYVDSGTALGGERIAVAPVAGSGLPAARG